METHHPFFRDNTKLQFLLIDRELMLPEFDNSLAINKEFFAIFQGPNRVIPRRIKTGLNVVALDRITQLGQLIDDIADLLNHEVAGEVAVDLVDLSKARETILDSCHN